MSLTITLGTEMLTHLRTRPNELQSPDIHDYLDMMMAEYESGSEQCLFLPSLMSMSECFQCSAVEVHQALSELKERGCDFFVMGFESPITLWYPSRIEPALKTG